MTLDIRRGHETASKQNSPSNLSVQKAAPVFGTLCQHQPLVILWPADAMIVHHPS
jgi:hypothetical protein